MKFRHRKFQADAEKAVVDVFAGQTCLTPADENFTGWANQKIVPALTYAVILNNIRKIQLANRRAGII